MAQTSFLVWTFFCRFSQQDSSSSCAAMIGPGLAGETTTQGRAYGPTWGGASYRLSGAIFYYKLQPNVDILGSVCLKGSGHPTTTWSKFFPILAPAPPRLDKHLHFIYYLPYVT